MTSGRRTKMASVFWLFSLLFLLNFVNCAGSSRVLSFVGEYSFSQCECSSGTNFSDTSGSIGTLSINSDEVSCPSKTGFATASRQGIIVSDSGIGSGRALTSPQGTVNSALSTVSSTGFTFDMWLRPLGLNVTGSMTLIDIRSPEQVSLPNYMCGIRYNPFRSGELRVYHGSVQLGDIYDIAVPLSSPLTVTDYYHVVCGWRIDTTIVPFACVNGVCVEDTGFSITGTNFEANATFVVGLTDQVSFVTPVKDVEIASVTVYASGLSSSDVDDNFNAFDDVVSHTPVPSNSFQTSMPEDTSQTLVNGGVANLFFDVDGNVGDYMFRVFPATSGELSLFGSPITQATLVNETSMESLTFTPDQGLYTSDDSGTCGTESEFIPAFAFQIIDEGDTSCVLNKENVEVCITQENDSPVAVASSTTVIDKSSGLVEITFTVGSDEDDVVHNNQPNNAGLDGGEIDLILTDLLGTLHEFSVGCTVENELLHGDSVSLTGPNLTLCYNQDPSSIDRNSGNDVVGTDQFEFSLFDKAGLQSSLNGKVNISVVNLIRTCTDSCESTSVENEIVPVNLSAEFEGGELDFRITSYPSNGNLYLASNPNVQVQLNTILVSSSLIYIPSEGYYNLNNAGGSSLNLFGDSICPGSASSCPDTFTFSASSGDSINSGIFEIYVKSVENQDTLLIAPSTYGFSQNEVISVSDISVDAQSDADMNEVRLSITPSSGVEVKLPNLDLVGFVDFESFPSSCTKGSFCDQFVKLVGVPTRVNEMLSQMQFTSSASSLTNPSIVFEVIDLSDQLIERESSSRTVSINYNSGSSDSVALGAAIGALVGAVVIVGAAAFIRFKGWKKTREVEVKEVLPPIPDEETPRSRKPVPPGHPSLSSEAGRNKVIRPIPPGSPPSSPKSPTAPKLHQPVPPSKPKTPEVGTVPVKATL